MRWVHRIGEDALARVEGVGTLRREGPIWFAARTRFGFGSFPVEQREIGDGAGPGELSVLKGGKVGRGGGEVRGWHDDKNEVPQGGGNHGAAGDFSLDPAFLEEVASQKVFGDTGPRQNGGVAAAHALVERAPGDVAIWAWARFTTPRARGS